MGCKQNEKTNLAPSDLQRKDTLDHKDPMRIELVHRRLFVL